MGDHADRSHRDGDEERQECNCQLRLFGWEISVSTTTRLNQVLKFDFISICELKTITFDLKGSRVSKCQILALRLYVDNVEQSLGLANAIQPMQNGQTRLINLTTESISTDGAGLDNELQDLLDHGHKPPQVLT